MKGPRFSKGIAKQKSTTSVFAYMNSKNNTSAFKWRLGTSHVAGSRGKFRAKQAMILERSRTGKEQRFSLVRVSIAGFGAPVKKAWLAPSHNATFNSAERIYWKSTRKSPINGPGLGATESPFSRANRVVVGAKLSNRGDRWGRFSFLIFEYKSGIKKYKLFWF